MRRPRLVSALALAVLMVGACARGTSERPPGDTAAVGGGTAPGSSVATPPAEPGVVPAPGGAAGGGDLAALQALERQARALARTEGCPGVAQCATAPVGSRPCGGPRTYIPYCRLTTDSVALFARLDELARREREYNARAGLASTCEFREPPAPTHSGGRCGPAAAP